MRRARGRAQDGGPAGARPSSPASSSPTSPATACPVARPGAAEPRGEVRAALAELGYGPEEIRRALDDVAPRGAVEEMLRQALRELAGAR